MYRELKYKDTPFLVKEIFYFQSNGCPWIFFPKVNSPFDLDIEFFQIFSRTNFYGHPLEYTLTG